MAKILVIDDTGVMRNLLSEFLTEEGHDVDTAVNGDDGIAKVLKGNYAIVFCDLHMPKKNGFQVYQQVTDVRPEQIFVFTDSMPDASSEKLAETGRFYILRKPFDLEQLRQVVTELAPSTIRYGTHH
jgi:CheY-like chemotaxis protein